MKKITISADGRGLSAREIADNFEDLHPRLKSEEAIAEASRCLYCYDAPCVQACPTRIDIPTFIHQIRTDNITGSAETILTANILGGTCARACPTEVLCEQACVVHHTKGAPVKISELQRYAVDARIDVGGPHPFTRAAATGKTCAVIGAGPAGLSFAHRAAMLGHDVTIYDAGEKPGGLNEYGLAAYKMVDDFARREIAFLLEIGGIEIRSGVRIGADKSLAELQAAHDVVFIGIGLETATELKIDGAELDGVEAALGFIRRLRQTEPKSDLVVGRDVVVIGGGNTAIDAAVQAKCLGAQTVTLAYRRGAEQMSATGWEQDLASTNGVLIRHWSAPVAFEGEGRVQSVTLERTELCDDRLIHTGETYTLPASMVLTAIGQSMSGHAIEGLETAHGKIVINGNYQTSLPGVYAGGDCTRAGDDLTVQAVEDGKQAAIAADAYLRTGNKGASA